MVPLEAVSEVMDANGRCVKHVTRDMYHTPRGMKRCQAANTKPRRDRSDCPWLACWLHPPIVSILSWRWINQQWKWKATMASAITVLTRRCPHCAPYTLNISAQNLRSVEKKWNVFKSVRKCHRLTLVLQCMSGMPFNALGRKSVYCDILFHYILFYTQYHSTLFIQWVVDKQ